jgi:hypothetical protein
MSGETIPSTEATEAAKTQMATYQREGQEFVSRLSKESALAPERLLLHDPGLLSR